MPKNSSGGNKAKRQGNKNTANKRDETRPLKLKGKENTILRPGMLRKIEILFFGHGFMVLFSSHNTAAGI